jgi:hypothetical protein
MNKQTRMPVHTCMQFSPIITSSMNNTHACTYEHAIFFLLVAINEIVKYIFICNVSTIS